MPNQFERQENLRKRLKIKIEEEESGALSLLQRLILPTPQRPTHLTPLLLLRLSLFMLPLLPSKFHALSRLLELTVADQNRLVSRSIPSVSQLPNFFSRRSVGFAA